jgi:predicted amino acid-binding ACT domain protein
MKKIKIIESSWSVKGVEKKVNEFIAQDGIKVLDIQQSAAFGFYAVMIVYEETGVER